MPLSFERIVTTVDGEELVTYQHPDGWYFRYKLKHNEWLEPAVEEHARRIWPILGIDTTGTAYSVAALTALKQMWAKVDSLSPDKRTEFFTFNEPQLRYLARGVFTDEACLAFIAECDIILNTLRVAS